jgi:ribosome modulation factor
MITRSVTIEDIDELYLMWNDHINASALYRRALREEMAVRDVDPDELRDLFERAREQGYSKGLCSFARRNSYDCVIAVESEETDWFDIRNPSLHPCYGC